MCPELDLVGIDGYVLDAVPLQDVADVPTQAIAGDGETVTLSVAEVDQVREGRVQRDSGQEGL